MRQITINKAQRLGNQKIDDVEIKITDNLPEFKEFEQLGKAFDFQAQLLASVLTETLPQGTLIRLIALLLTNEAEKNYLRVKTNTQ